jgi:hypothetical protein
MANINNPHKLLTEIRELSVEADVEFVQLTVQYRAGHYEKLRYEKGRLTFLDMKSPLLEAHLNVSEGED